MDLPVKKKAPNVNIHWRRATEILPVSSVMHLRQSDEYFHVKQATNDALTGCSRMLKYHTINYVNMITSFNVIFSKRSCCKSISEVNEYFWFAFPVFQPFIISRWFKT